MGLSCSCPDWDDSNWYYTVKSKLLNNEPIYNDGKVIWDEEFFFPLATKRSRICKSCKKKIAVGDLCIEFERKRNAANDIEERIYGGEVEMASWFHCEECGEQYLNLEALGYCVDINENMHNLLKEYREEHDY